MDLADLATAIAHLVSPADAPCTVLSDPTCATLPAGYTDRIRKIAVECMELQDALRAGALGGDHSDIAVSRQPPPPPSFAGGYNPYQVSILYPKYEIRASTALTIIGSSSTELPRYEQ